MRHTTNEKSMNLSETVTQSIPQDQPVIDRRKDRFIIEFNIIDSKDILRVGGKNASLERVLKEGGSSIRNLLAEYKIRQNI